jgi:hypothetical protein
MADANLVSIGEALEGLEVQHCRIEANIGLVLHRLAIIEARNAQQEKLLMAVSDDLAIVSGNLVTIGNGIVALDAKIVALQNTPGPFSPADQTAFDAIVKHSGELAAAAGNMPGVTPPTTVAAP